MSDILATPTKPTASRKAAADLRALAQVEKWMATIREISREPSGEPTFRVRLRPTVAAVAKE